MKKVIALLVLILLLTGCTTDKQIVESQEYEINKLDNEIAELEERKEELTNIVQEIKTDKDIEKYVVTLNISQSHFTLDVGKHIKNAMNDIEIQLPVDKEFYDSVEVGDLLDNSFRVGSLLMEGSFGKWKVKVIKKEIM